MLPVTMALSYFDGDALPVHYFLPFLQMTSCFHTNGPMSRWVDTALCSKLAPVDLAAGRAWAAAAHWLTGSVDRLAGVHWLGWVLAVWRLDLATLGMVVRISPCASC